MKRFRVATSCLAGVGADLERAVEGLGVKLDAAAAREVFILGALIKSKGFGYTRTPDGKLVLTAPVEFDGRVSQVATQIAAEAAIEKVPASAIGADAGAGLPAPDYHPDSSVSTSATANQALALDAGSAIQPAASFNPNGLEAQEEVLGQGAASLLESEKSAQPLLTEKAANDLLDRLF